MIIQGHSYIIYVMTQYMKEMETTVLNSIFVHTQCLLTIFGQLVSMNTHTTTTSNILWRFGLVVTRWLRST